MVKDGTGEPVNAMIGERQEGLEAEQKAGGRMLWKIGG